MTLSSALDSLESASFLDKESSAINTILKRGLDGNVVGRILRGSWIGHPIHPALVNVTIGTWTSAVVLDYAGGDGSASRRLITIGLLSAPPTLATGWADWSTMGPRARRVGLIHAGSNATGVFLFLGSLLRRRNDTDAVAKALAAAGLAAVSLGGVIGGHLAYSVDDADAGEDVLV